jgi:hypothetical protein
MALAATSWPAGVVGHCLCPALCRAIARVGGAGLPLRGPSTTATWGRASNRADRPLQDGQDLKALDDRTGGVPGLLERRGEQRPIERLVAGRQAGIVEESPQQAGCDRGVALVGEVSCFVSRDPHSGGQARNFTTASSHPPGWSASGCHCAMPTRWQAAKAHQPPTTAARSTDVRVTPRLRHPLPGTARSGWHPLCTGP